MYNLAMSTREVTMLVGGAAGDGIASVGESFAKICSRLGLHVLAYNSYQSVIRGGHVYLQVRTGVDPVLSHGDGPDFVIALNQDTMDRHANDVRIGGGVLYNRDKITLRDEHLSKGVTPYPLPVGELTKPFGNKPIMQNTVALGALMYFLQLPFEVLEGVFKHTWADKAESVVTTNIQVAKAGYDYAKEHFKPHEYGLTFSMKGRMLLNGNQAFGVGAIAAGCKFYAAYPMTPATSLLHYLAAAGPQHGMVVKQAEDEIAVVNMAIGAGFAGVRSMCGTSGGGFALMTEAIGMAGITETPIVIMTSQRGGPSTGVPTKTEQGDLFQVLGASQGDFPKAVIAPTNMADAFHATVEAFNLAEKYQVPVILMSDLYLSEHMETIEPLPTQVPIERGPMAQPNGKRYERYADTPSGVSPRAFPGQEGMLFIASSDEHTEDGTLISDIFTNPVIRERVMKKRMRKLDGILKDTKPPVLQGPADAPVTLIGWGSTEGVLQESIQRLTQEGIKVNHLHLRHIYPFHADEISKILKSCKKLVMTELNFTGQMAKHLRSETGINVDYLLVKYDGEPFEPAQIVDYIKKLQAGSITDRVTSLLSTSGLLKIELEGKIWQTAAS